MRRPVFLAFSVIAFPVFSAPCFADTRDDVRAASQRCDRIVEERAWLDCYYGAAQPMRARLGLPPAPNAQQALVPPAGPGAAVNQAPAASGNFFERLLTQRDVKAEAPTHMASYSFDKAGFFTVTLSNGEIWKQSSVDAIQAKWRGQPGTYVVTILPGSKMKVGAHETYMVERVR
jgi:hypothetical protein